MLSSKLSHASAASAVSRSTSYARPALCLVPARVATTSSAPLPRCFAQQHQQLARGSPCFSFASDDAPGGEDAAQSRARVSRFPRSSTDPADFTTRSLRMRGLPRRTSEDDIRHFFQGFNVNAVIMPRKDQGRLHGEGYVLLDSPAACAQAVAQLDRTNFDDQRFLELHPCSVCPFEEPAVSTQVAQLEGCVVRMRGLPWSATEEDVLAFFGGLDIVPGGIVLSRFRDGRPTGEAHVVFRNQSDEAAALARENEKVGTRYIELFPSNREEMLAKQQAPKSFQR